MPVITVKGLGQVRIAGDVPTEEERQNMLAEIERRGGRAGVTAAAPEWEGPTTASMQAALEPLLGLEERFAAMDDPRSRRSFAEQAVRAPAARLAEVATDAAIGLPVALSEVATGVARDEPLGAGRMYEAAMRGRPVEALMEAVRPRFAAAEESVKDYLADLYTPSVSTSEEALSGAEKTATFIGEGVAGAMGDVASMVLFGPLRYAASMVPQIANQRVAERGGGAVTEEDLAYAVPAAAAIAGLNQAALKVGLNSNEAHSLLRKTVVSGVAETATELPQQAIEIAASQYGARPGGISGGSMVEGLRSAAMIAPFAGGAVPAGAAGLRRAGRAIESSPQQREERLAERVQAMRPEPQEEAAPATEYLMPGIPSQRLDFDEWLAGEIGPPIEPTPAAAEPTPVVEAVAEEVVTPTAEVVAEPVVVEERGPLPLEPGSAAWLEWVRYGGLDPMEHLKQEAVAEEVVTPTAEEVAEEVVEPSADEPTIEGVIEEPAPRAETVTGFYDQVAPPPVPIEAGPEVDAIGVQMEKDRLADSIKEARKAAEEARKAAGVPPRPSGAKIRAVVDKGAKRRRVEEIETPPEPMSAKDAIRRLALVANETTSTEADMTDAVYDVAAAEMRDERGISAPRNIDNVDRLKEVARSMGRSDEEIDALLSHQKMSFADVIAAMDAAGMRSTLGGDGMSVDIPRPTMDLIEAVNDGRHTPTNVETAAIHSTYRTALKARENILLATDDATTKAEIDSLIARDSELRTQELNALLAQKRGGTPAAQAMRFRQYLIDPVMNMVEAQARATLKKRKPLTDKEIETIEKLWDAAEKAEAQAVESEAKAQKSLKKATRRLRRAEDALRASEDVKKEVAKKTRKPKKKKTPRQKAAEKEAGPIRVTPLKKSAQQRALEKEFKQAQKAARQDADKVQKTQAAARKAKRAKANVPDQAIHPWLAMYRKAFGAALVLNASGDNSALGRQALGLAIQMPASAFKTIPMAVRAAPWTPGHRAYARKMQEEILSSPMQPLRDFARVEMTQVEGLSNMDDSDPVNAREEAFMFRSFETGFIADVLVQPSQNIFGLTLNKLRADAFDEGARLVADLHGLDIDAVRNADLKAAPDGSPEQRFANDIKGLGLLINVSTGRGTWNQKALGVARHLMFAPRYTVSRFELPIRGLQLAAGKGAFSDVSPEARSLFMKRAARQMSWSMGMMVMSAIAAGANGEDVSDAIDAFFDPENPDFLKMRIGDYHIDVLQGLGATWRYVWPFAFSPGRAFEKGDLTEIFSPRKAYGRAYLQLARNKLAPLISSILKVYPGMDYRGRIVTDLPRRERESYQMLGRLPRDVAEKYQMPTMEAGDKTEAVMAWLLDRAVFPALGLITPITVQQVASNWASSATEGEKTLAQQAIPVALSFFGISTAHYKPSKKKGRGPRTYRPPAPPKTRISPWDR